MKAVKPGVGRSICVAGLLAAIIGCRPVEGVTYTDPNRPEAQDWSTPPEREPEASIESEHRRLEGQSGSGACGQRGTIRQAFGQLEYAPVPDGVDRIEWKLAVAKVGDAVDEVIRVIDEECHERVLPSRLSRANDALGSAIDGVTRLRER